MKKLSIFLIAILIMASGCQKDSSDDAPTAPGSTADADLIMVFLSEYQYDSSGRLWSVCFTAYYETGEYSITRVEIFANGVKKTDYDGSDNKYEVQIVQYPPVIVYARAYINSNPVLSKTSPTYNL